MTTIRPTSAEREAILQMIESDQRQARQGLSPRSSSWRPEPPPLWEGCTILDCPNIRWHYGRTSTARDGVPGVCRGHYYKLRAAALLDEYAQNAISPSTARRLRSANQLDIRHAGKTAPPKARATSDTRCAGGTVRGKQCSRFAVYEEFCTIHRIKERLVVSADCIPLIERVLSGKESPKESPVKPFPDLPEAPKPEYDFVVVRDAAQPEVLTRILCTYGTGAHCRQRKSRAKWLCMLSCDQGVL